MSYTSAFSNKYNLAPSKNNSSVKKYVAWHIRSGICYPQVEKTIFVKNLENNLFELLIIFRWNEWSGFPDRQINRAHSPSLKFVSAIFYQIFIFHQMIALQKLWKIVFISSKKLFSFERYLNFCIFVFPSFLPCQPLL